jgi:hypothetical protein
VYRNRNEKHYHLLLEQYFYCVFIDSTFGKEGEKNTCTDQHRILMPKGINCKPRYPIDYDYTRGMLIMHKPLNKDNTLDKLFKNKQRTIDEFLHMLDQKEVPISVQAQYVTVMKYARKKRLEVHVKDGVNHPNIEDNDNDKETNNRMTAWIQGSHLTDDKLLNENMNNITADIGKNKDWSISNYKERRLTTIDGKEYLNQPAKMYYNSNDSAGTGNTLKIPNTKDGKEYSIESMATEQNHVVLAVIHTIIKFLKNNKAYVPIHATIMRCGQ